MSPERWNRIEEIFLAVADLPPDQRQAKLEEACGGDATLLAGVTRLLLHDQAGAGAAKLAEAVGGVARSVPQLNGEVSYEHRRIGPYRVVREIGRGGMGVVFEAVRDDDEYNKRVAVKVASRVAYSPEFLRRFREERQILAKLEHPNIARLLDGGTTGDGIPYFAMEFVEGTAIRDYVTSAQLTVQATLRLFLQVCDAVEYAHQNLVIHRDLKPGNILVTHDGSVRLLDFGIAKLADPSGDGSAVQTAPTGLGPLTPDYCSPEQVRGLGVTTRTDVYALGLVLFELLTGERAQNADTTSPLAFDRSICETEVRAPSASLAQSADKVRSRQMRGDLDTIVLQATQKEPARRYASVAAFADDIRRFLDSRPVLARQDTTWYRASKFVRRHWIPVAAGTALVVTLVAGIVTTRYQAQRAERRFEQVRRIARALMTDVHGAIRNLPGSAKAQAVVIHTAVEYLDSLAREAGNDASLQVEIAQGYIEVSEFSYSTVHSSLDRPDDARRYLEQARAILDPLLQASPANREAAVAYINLETTLAKLEESRDDRSAAQLAAYERAIRVGDAAKARFPGDLNVLEAILFAQAGLIAGFTSSPAAHAQVASYLENAERVTQGKPRTNVTISQLGVAYSQAGKIAKDEGKLDEARRYFQRNVDLHTELVAMEPHNAIGRRNLLIGLFTLGDLHLGPLGPTALGRFGGSVAAAAAALDPKERERARVLFDKGLEQARWLIESDPSSEAARFDHAIASGRSAPAYPPGDPRALQALETALAALREMEPRNPRRVIQFQMEFRCSRAERFREKGWLDRAVAEWRGVETLAQAILSKDPGSAGTRRELIAMYQNWAEELARRGDRAGARDIARKTEQRALELAGLAEVDIRARGWLPRIKTWKAELFERLGDPGEAADLRQAAKALWKELTLRSELPPDLRAEAVSVSTQP